MPLPRITLLRADWLLVALLVLAALPVQAPAAEATTRPGGETYAEQLFAAGHDATRRTYGGTEVVHAGTTELVWSAELAELARSASDRMARGGSIAHDPAIRDTLCCGAPFADNVGRAAGTPVDDPTAIRRTVAQLTQAWLRSSGHRANMLDPRFSHIGVGVVIDAQDTLWVTAVFQSRTATVASGTAAFHGDGATGPACPDGTGGAGFIDVAGEHADAIDCLAARGIIQGVSEDRFDPSSTVTRAQLALLLTRTLTASERPLPAPLSGAFDDVRPGMSSAEAVERLTAAGIVLGRPDGRFDPAAPITRGQLAAQLEATLRYLDGEVAQGERERFADVPTSRRFSRAIDASAHAGLLAGDHEGRFHPDAPLRRDQTASVIMRLLERELG